MASCDALDSQPRTPDHPETTDRVGRVLRAAWLEAAARAKDGAYQFLVGLDEEDGYSSRHASQSGDDLFQPGPRSVPAPDPSEIQDTRVPNGTVGTVSPAITTKSNPAGTPATRMASRSLLFVRLRITALPIRRPVTSPNRTIPGCPTARTITKSPTRRRRPVARTVRKLAGERSETGLGGETLAAFCTP